MRSHRSNGLIVVRGWNLIMLQAQGQDRIVFQHRTSSSEERRCSVRGIGQVAHHAGLPFGWNSHKTERSSERQVFHLWILGEVESQDLCRLALLQQKRRVWGFSVAGLRCRSSRLERCRSSCEHCDDRCNHFD